MQSSSLATRLERLPTVEVGGLEVPVATGVRARMLGLAGLDLERAGPGLLIPRCSSVHTFGMRFALALVFLDECGRALSIRHSVPARRVAGQRGAAAVLELPCDGGHHPHLLAESGHFAAEGGERERASSE
jgi:hypothetical protein